MAISGHHSKASLRNYIGRPSSEKIRACSDILSDALSGRPHQSLQPSVTALSPRAIFTFRWIRLSLIHKTLALNCLLATRGLFFATREEGRMKGALFPQKYEAWRDKKKTRAGHQFLESLNKVFYESSQPCIWFRGSDTNFWIRIRTRLIGSWSSTEIPVVTILRGITLESIAPNWTQSLLHYHWASSFEKRVGSKGGHVIPLCMVTSGIPVEV